MPDFRNIFLCGLLIAGAAALLAGQSSIPGAPTIPVPQIHPGLGTNKAAHPAVTKPHEPSCWQLAGISKATMDRRAGIVQSTKGQIEAVCANSALSAQQRSQELSQIFKQRQRELEATITLAQAQEMKACNQERAALHPPVIANAGPRRGPCGEILPTPNPTPMPKPQPGTNPSPGSAPQD